MKLKYSIFSCIGLLLVAVQVQSEIYRCVGVDGKLGFQDDRCRANETESTVDVSDPRRHLQLKATKDSAKLVAPGAGARVNSDNLLGLWCAFSRSKDGSNKYQDNDPAIWNFKDYAQMSSTPKSAFSTGQEVFSNYRLEGVKIIPQDPSIGEWEVIEFNGSTLTIFNGSDYQYLRKGVCF